jgi:hypothetical protein
MRAKWGEYSGSWLAFFPPSPPVARRLGYWKVVSSYSSATASGFHGIPRFHLLLLIAKNCEECAREIKGMSRREYWDSSVGKLKKLSPEGMYVYPQ